MTALGVGLALGGCAPEETETELGETEDVEAESGETLDVDFSEWDLAVGRGPGPGPAPVSGAGFIMFRNHDGPRLPDRTAPRRPGSGGGGRGRPRRDRMRPLGASSAGDEEFVRCIRSHGELFWAGEPYVERTGEAGEG